MGSSLDRVVHTQVQAVREGLVLVIDEADKAPTNVTCVLKTLVESGQMHLSDGRKIVNGEYQLVGGGGALSAPTLTFVS